MLQMKITHTPLAPRPGKHVGARVFLSLSISAAGVGVPLGVGASLISLSRWQALAARVIENQARGLRLLKRAQSAHARECRQAFLWRVDPIPVKQVVLPNGLQDIGELESCDYVVQFADCTSAKGAPRPCVASNPYAERRAARSKRIAASDDFAKVGTISVRGAPATIRAGLKVVNFFMQWGAGPPSASASIQPGPRSDTERDRFGWFKQCLEALADLVKASGQSRVAIPWGHRQMGSELWGACREELREFCLRVPGVRLTIVQSTADHIEHMQAKTAAADVSSAHALAREAASLIEDPRQRALALALNDNLAAVAGAAVRGSSVISSPENLAEVCKTHASVYPSGGETEDVASDVFASAMQALVMAAAQPAPELISLPGLEHVEDETLARRYRCPPQPLLQELLQSGCLTYRVQGGWYWRVFGRRGGGPYHHGVSRGAADKVHHRGRYDGMVEKERG